MPEKAGRRAVWADMWVYWLDGLMREGTDRFPNFVKLASASAVVNVEAHIAG